MREWAAPTQVADADLAAFRARAARWLAEHVPTGVLERRGDDVAVFHDLTDDEETRVLEALRAWQRTKFDAGFGALTWPPELGGAGLTIEHELAFREEEAAAAALVRHELVSVTLNLIAPTVRMFGQPELRELLLPGLIDGSLLACQLFSEPDAGSDLAGAMTRGCRDGSDWLLTGQKVWTSGARHAEWGQAIVRTDPDAGKHQGLTAFMVPMDADGVDIRPIRQMSGGASFCEVFLTDVRVPDAYRLGEAGEGWQVTRATLGFERANSSKNADVGGQFDQLVSLAQRAGRLGERGVRRDLARVLTYQHLARVAVQRERQARQTGEPTGAIGSARKQQWVDKLHLVSELAADLLGPAMAIDTGETGTFLWTEHVLGAPGYRIAGGTEQIQKNIIAERHLGLPREPRAATDRNAN